MISSIDYILTENVEDLYLVGAVSGTGNALGNIIYGTRDAQILSGLDGDDTLIGLGGDDDLLGGLGNDVLNGGAGADDMQGGDGDDRYIVDNLGDVVVEGVSAGQDTVVSSLSYTLADNLEHLALRGAAAVGMGNSVDNRITGNDVGNTLSGMGGNDTLTGLAGDDILLGGEGNDRLSGGAGRDVLSGGAGSDRFVWTALSDFAGLDFLTADRITGGFNQRVDRIDLRGVDAITGGTDDRFVFIGNNAFSSTAGELRFEVTAAGTMIYGDVDGDGAADFAIAVSGAVAFVESDFIL